MKLYQLPDEILTYIAGHLDRKSASSLAITCRISQQPAESSVWRTVTLTRRDLSSACYYRYRQADRRSSLQDIRDLLARLNGRASLIRHLELELADEIPCDLIELLNRVCGGLEGLSLRLPRTPTMKTPTIGFVSICQIFSSLKAPFAALRTCTVEMHNEGQHILISLLHAAPSLRSLCMRDHHLDRAADRSTPQVAHAEALPHLPHLSELLIEQPHDGHESFLAALVKQASNIIEFTIYDPFIRWTPSQGESLFMNLSRLTHLTNLDITSACLGAVCESSGFQSVEELSVLWEAAVVNDQNAEVHLPCLHRAFQADDRFDQDLLIPPLPSLRVLQLEIAIPTLQIAMRIQGAQSTRIGAYLSAKRVLMTASLSRFCASPRLTVIHCPTYLDFSRSDSLPTWQDRTFQGLLIYSFTDGVDELVHLRSPAKMDGQWSENERPVSPSNWEEKGWYNSVEVPVGLLAAVYTVAGLDLAGLEPRRGATLPDKGWEVLRYWKVQE